MKTKMRKFLVAALTVTMILGTSSMAFAGEATGSGSGTGSADIVAQDDVFSVNLPASTGSQFNYILDPGHVISDTDAAKYDGATFKNAKDETMFFKQDASATEAGEVSDYESTSSKVTAVNMGTQDVTMTVSAKVVSADEVEVTTVDGAKGTTKGAAIGFKLTDDFAVAVSAADTSVSKDNKINKTDGMYEVTWSEAKGYAKQLKDDVEVSDFEGNATFGLTGACSTDSSAWRDVTQLPKVDLVWSVNDKGESATANSPKVTLSSSGLITVSGLTADANITTPGQNISVGPTGSMSTINKLSPTWDSSNYDATDGGTMKVTIGSSYVTQWSGQEVNVSVTLTDGTTITTKATL